MNPRHDSLVMVLGVQLKLVQDIIITTTMSSLVGSVPAADGLAVAAHRGAAAAVVGAVGIGRVADRGVDLEEAADEGFQEGGAGCDYAYVELQAGDGDTFVSDMDGWIFGGAAA
jgi:hypothetical protein